MMKENFKEEIIKLALVNAPINVRYNDSTSIFFPPLGLMSIKAYIEAHLDNVQIELFDGMVYTNEEIIKKISLFKPNIVGVSIQLLSYKNAILICKEAKKIGSVTFMGGHHATQLFQSILLNKHKYVDFIIKGDGEIPIMQLCQGVDVEKIFNLVYFDKRNNKIVSNHINNISLDVLVNPYQAKDIDYLPYIINYKKSKFSYSGGRYYRIYSHKGCSFRKQGKRCVFCGRADEGYRFFTVENYFNMIKSLNLQSEDFLFDVGDDLLGNDIWLAEALKYKKEKEIKMCAIGIFGRGDEITEKKANMLYDLGVRDITVGVESGDNYVLDKVEKEILGANVFYNAAKVLFEKGIEMTPSYVLGLPGENRKSVYNTVKHAERIKELSISILGHQPNEMVANLLEPIPGSHAFEELIKAFPEKYLNVDELDLEQMQKDYTCLIHNFNANEYKEYRKFLVEEGMIINNMVEFSDPQGWLRSEMKG